MVKHCICSQKQSSSRLEFQIPEGDAKKSRRTFQVAIDMDIPVAVDLVAIDTCVVDCVKLRAAVSYGSRLAAF